MGAKRPKSLVLYISRATLALEQVPARDVVVHGGDKQKRTIPPPRPPSEYVKEKKVYYSSRKEYSRNKYSISTLMKNNGCKYLHY